MPEGRAQYLVNQMEWGGRSNDELFDMFDAQLRGAIEDELERVLEMVRAMGKLQTDEHTAADILTAVDEVLTERRAHHVQMVDLMKEIRAEEAAAETAAAREEAARKVEARQARSEQSQTVVAAQP